MALDNEELNKRREERAKRREQRQQRKEKLQLISLIVIAVFLVIAIVAVLVVYLGGFTPSLPQPGETQIQTQPPETTLPPETDPPETEPQETLPPDTVIHVVAGGDLNITDKVVAAGQKEDGFDYSQCFIDVLPVLSAGDVTILNFEGTVSGEPFGSKRRSAPHQLLQALDRAGVDLLQTANSQSVTNSQLGLVSTLNAIRAAGMEPVGTFASSAEFKKTGGFTMLEVQGIRIAVVAFTKGMDGRGLPEGTESCVNLLYTDYNSYYRNINTDGIKKILKEVKKEEPDITIALLHWGKELNDEISKTQKSIVTLMQENGVNAIIGTHPHYVQQMTFDPETGNFVAYSLGDFFGDRAHSGTEYSVLLDLQITRNGVTGEVSITGFDYTPLFLVDDTQTGGTLRVLRLKEAMESYESHFLGCVSKDVYEDMKHAMERIEDRIHAKVK